MPRRAVRSDRGDCRVPRPDCGARAARPSPNLPRARSSAPCQPLGTDRRPEGAYASSCRRLPASDLHVGANVLTRRERRAAPSSRFCAARPRTAPAWIPAAARSYYAQRAAGRHRDRRSAAPAATGPRRRREDLDSRTVAGGGREPSSSSSPPALDRRSGLCFAELIGPEAGTPSCRRLGDWRLGDSP